MSVGGARDALELRGVWLYCGGWKWFKEGKAEMGRYRLLMGRIWT
jgi:hypothetical protein